MHLFANRWCGRNFPLQSNVHHLHHSHPLTSVCAVWLNRPQAESQPYVDEQLVMSSASQISDARVSVGDCGGRLHGLCSGMRPPEFIPPPSPAGEWDGYVFAHFSVSCFDWADVRSAFIFRKIGLFAFRVVVLFAFRVVVLFHDRSLLPPFTL